MKRLPSQSHSEQSVALVITLGVLAVILLMVVGFLISARTQNTASRNFSDLNRAREGAQAAIAEAMCVIRIDTPTIDTANFWVTLPGRIIVISNGVSAVGPQYDLLYSYDPTSTAFDLNIDRSIINSNDVYNSVVNRRMQVHWINIGADGAPAGVNNPVVFRYCYWVDTDANRISIQAAESRINALGPTTKEVDLTVLPGIDLGIATNSYNYSTSVGYVTTEQFKTNLPAASAGSTFESNKFYITAFSENVDFAPWGAQKWCLNTNFNTWKAEIDAGCTKTLNAIALTNWFGPGNTFTNKYGTNVLKQIAANVADYQYNPVSLAWLGATGFGDSTTSGLLDNGLAGTYGIPRDYHGLRRTPYLNEIGVQATYWRPNSVTEIQCKLWFLVEVVNPYNEPLGANYQIRIHMDKLTYRVVDGGGVWNYYCGMDTGWAQNSACPGGNTPVSPSGQEVTYTITADIPANSYQVFEIPVWAGNPETDADALLDEVYVRVNKVRLLQNSADETSIRDWAQIGDFDTQLSSGNHFTFLGAKIRYEASGNFPGYDNDYTHGIAKNDPRVRRFVGWTPPGSGTQLPWSPVGYEDSNACTLPNASGAENSTVNYTGGTGLTGVPNDRVPTGTAVVSNHPSFYLKATYAGNADSSYESVGELGYIHSGLQWRTLMLQPRPADERSANLIPDWAAMDIFTLDTRGQSRKGRISINTGITNLSSATLGQRITPIKSLLTAITDASGYGPTTNQDWLASNIYNLAWAPSSTWGNDRTNTTTGYNFINFPNAYAMIGELCEINGVSTNFPSGSPGDTNDVVREARIRSFANLVTTRSERFTVYAVGQAVKVVPVVGGGSQIKVLAEAKAQAVVQRLQTHDGTGEYGNANNTNSYKILYFRYLD